MIKHIDGEDEITPAKLRPCPGGDGPSSLRGRLLLLSSRRLTAATRQDSVVLSLIEATS